MTALLGSAQVRAAGCDVRQLVYYGAFEPPTVAHADDLRDAIARYRPERVLVAPVDRYDGDVHLRRWLRVRYAQILAAIVDAEATDIALSCRTVPSTVEALTMHHPSLLFVAGDTPPELRPAASHPSSERLTIRLPPHGVLRSPQAQLLPAAEQLHKALSR